MRGIAKLMTLTAGVRRNSRACAEDCRASIGSRGAMGAVEGTAIGMGGALMPAPRARPRRP